MVHRATTIVLYLVAAALGVVAFLFPFFLPSQSQGADQSLLPINQTPLLTVLLITLCLAALMIDMQGQSIGAKTVATLGVLVAVTSTLRFIEVAVPGPGGFSPIFAPIILGGYIFGARFGFLLGAMTMLVSGIITAGVGPWLPYQMFTAGWVGLSAGWLPHLKQPRAEVGMLVVFGALWGFLYGAIMNLYTWPFLAGDPQISYVAGAGAADVLRRYAAFYLATSLVWDLGAVAGNVILLTALGLPALHALARFRDRLQFEVRAT